MDEDEKPARGFDLAVAESILKKVYLGAVKEQLQNSASFFEALNPRQSDTRQESRAARWKRERKEDERLQYAVAPKYLEWAAELVGPEGQLLTPPDVPQSGYEAQLLQYKEMGGLITVTGPENVEGNRIIGITEPGDVIEYTAPPGPPQILTWKGEPVYADPAQAPGLVTTPEEKARYEEMLRATEKERIYGGINRASSSFWRAQEAKVPISAEVIQQSVRQSDQPTVGDRVAAAWELTKDARYQAQQNEYQSQILENRFPRPQPTERLGERPDPYLRMAFCPLCVSKMAYAQDNMSWYCMDCSFTIPAESLDRYRGTKRRISQSQRNAPRVYESPAPPPEISGERIIQLETLDDRTESQDPRAARSGARETPEG